jgi:hypothetical protein
MSGPIAWLDTEPVRTRLYPVISLVVGYLVTRGAVDSNTADLVIGLVSALLGVGATEAARARVSPVPPHTPTIPPA